MSQMSLLQESCITVFHSANESAFSKRLVSETLVIIDPSVTEFETIKQGIIPGTSILVLNPQQDGIEQISDFLKNNPDLTYLHFISHGSSGSLYLGQTKLSLENLSQYALQLKQWPVTEIFLYGCQVAKNAQGKHFVKHLAEITGANIAASSTLVGNAQLGGNWELDFITGTITSPLALNQELQDQYPAVLVDVQDGDITQLITAILRGNDSSEEFVINLAKGGTYDFTEAFANSPEENQGLTALPNITGNIKINGDGATIKGNSSNFRLFYVNSGGTLTLEKLKLSNGRVESEDEDGGGIFNEGTVTINESSITTNNAGGRGGAIHNLGNLTINRSTFSGNESSRDGGAIHNFGDNADLTVNRSTLSGNTSELRGGAIFNTFGKATVNNSTIARNTGIADAGGVVNFIATGGTTQLKSTIVIGNKIGDIEGNIAGTITSAGHNLIGLGGGFQNTQESDITQVDNQPINLAEVLTPTLALNGAPQGSPQTHALVEESLAIDAGNAESRDQRDAFAVDIPDVGVNGTPTPDIGSFEFGARSQVEIIRTSDGRSIADDTGQLSFGIVEQNTPKTIELAVLNRGALPLLLGELKLPDGFTLFDPFPKRLDGTPDPNNPTQSIFKIRLDTLNPGQYEGELSFETNDVNIGGEIDGENPDSIYNFNLIGSVRPETTEDDDNGGGGGGTPISRNEDTLTLDSSTNFFILGKEAGNNLKLKLTGTTVDQIAKINIKFKDGNSNVSAVQNLFDALPSRYHPNGFNAAQSEFILTNIQQQVAFTLEIETLENGIIEQSFTSEQLSQGQYSIQFSQGISLEVQQTNDTPPLGVGTQQTQNFEAFDLQNINETVQAAFTVYREANFNNVVGLYRVDNPNGTVNGLAPGQAGYAEAAIRNHVSGINLSTGDEVVSSFNHSLEGGGFYLPFLITQGSIESFLNENPENVAGDIPQAYFISTAANPDGVDHIRLLGNNTFGFEDLSGGGDRDFNDIILQAEVTIA